MAATEHVILVNESDQFLGTAEKIEAHQKGWCHRAFSIFLFRQKKSWEILLQQRAANKYHSANLWTNACCSHPRPGEEIILAAERRLKEELGMTVPLENQGHFHYVAHFPNDMIENEIDHVLIGTIQNQIIQADPNEVQAYRWISIESLQQELVDFPKQFTPWFTQALQIALAKRSR